MTAGATRQPPRAPRKRGVRYARTSNASFFAGSASGLARTFARSLEPDFTSAQTRFQTGSNPISDQLEPGLRPARMCDGTWASARNRARAHGETTAEQSCSREVSRRALPILGALGGLAAKQKHGSAGERMRSSVAAQRPRARRRSGFAAARLAARRRFSRRRSAGR